MHSIRKDPTRIAIKVLAAVQRSLIVESSINHSEIDLLTRLSTETVLRRVRSPPSPPEVYSERLSRRLPVVSELWRDRPPVRVDDSRLEEGGPRSSRSQSGVLRSRVDDSRLEEGGALSSRSQSGV
jgi:hypothetical protein